MKEIQYVIIYLIMENKYQNNGKMSNISILKNQNRDKILLLQCIKHIMIKRFQINSIIIIPILLVIMEELLP